MSFSGSGIRNGSSSMVDQENGVGERSRLLGSVSGSGVEGRSLWSKLTFRWFTPLLHRGNEKKKLDQDDLDLIPLPEGCRSNEIYAAFDNYWQQELKQSKPSLLRALFRAFGKEYIQAGVLKVMHDLCIFVGPQVLHGIILFLRNPNAPFWHGLLLTAAVTLSQLIMSFCLRHYFFKCYKTGLRMRSAVVVAVYRKALVLAASERRARTVGEITNLMSIDAQRIQDQTNYFHSIWSSPLQIALSLVFLCQQLGPSSFGGVAVIIVMIPVTQMVASWMGAMQQKLMKAKDGRVDLNSEVLSNMKIVKLQAWEESFQKRIMSLRGIEMKLLLQYIIGGSFANMLWSFTPPLVAIATFATYVWTGHTLDVAEALTALALFDILRFPLFMLPYVISSAVEAVVSINRIRSFLLCDEHQSIPRGSRESTGVRLKDVSVTFEPKLGPGKDSPAADLARKQWELDLLRSQLDETERLISELSGEKSYAYESSNESPSLLCLKRITFECKPGEMIAVVGSVGCGKSSLVHAMLGELKAISGSIEIGGKLSYFSQSPYIMNATVRDNVLFGHLGHEIDEELYQRALACCALGHDLDMLPYGDQTEIGEKGITLSGGQKARVALARAVYHNADVTIIDDALSAVDAHVARHIFEDAIVGELLNSKEQSNRKRSVILVTNALQYLNHPRVDKIVVLREGRVAEEGTFADLAGKSDSLFRKFLVVIDDSGVSTKSTGNGASEGSTTLIPTKAKASFGQALQNKTNGATPLMTEEARRIGHVTIQMYYAWVKAAGGAIVPIAILLAFAVNEGSSVLSNWWLTYWSNHGSEHSQTTFLAFYGIINLSSGLISLTSTLLLYLFGWRASQNLFKGLLNGALFAPMSFFDTTPVGRIVNRFSKDMYTVDEQLTNTLEQYVSTVFNVLSTAVVISTITPVFTICLVPMILFYINEQKFFTLTYRELKRLDSVNRSPIYALLGESVDGVAVIRAFGAEGSLFLRLRNILDLQQHAYFLTCSAQSWLAIRLELIGTLIVSFACLSALVEHMIKGPDETFAGLAGLAISYALSVTQSLNWSVRVASDVEANMVAVERIDEYSRIPNEGDREIPKDKDIMASWPSKGAIEFRNAQMRYRPDLPLVLKGLNLVVPGGSKVGVVGRTGAGKSSLMVALMRLVELSDGEILIDGENMRHLGLASVRRAIAMIPQDPVLFSGTVRSNLDPFDHFEDDELYSALERVGLFKAKDSIASSSHSASPGVQARIESLDDVVTEGGSNYSVGQRQLLVIARALSSCARIVVIDEATAAVDAETDAAIQKVMRTEFVDATCLTVAHRLNTVMDSDYILVMEDGQLAEFDSPFALVERGGLYRDLVKAALRD